MTANKLEGKARELLNEECAKFPDIGEANPELFDADKAALRAIVRALDTARQSEGMVLDKLRAFAADVLDYWPNGAPDGGDLQEVAVRHGLLIATPAVVPCGENCACTEFYDEGDTADCYHRAPWLAAAPADAGEATQPERDGRGK